MSSYRAAKEGFGGCSGGDIVAILANLLVRVREPLTEAAASTDGQSSFQLTHLLHRALPAHLASSRRSALESVTLVMPLLAITTVLGHRLWPATDVLGLCVLMAWGRKGRGAGGGGAGAAGDGQAPIEPGAAGRDSHRAGSAPRSRRHARLQPPLRFHQPFLTVYRVQLVLLTALSILAVDFTIFPRKFAMTESWGISLGGLLIGSASSSPQVFRPSFFLTITTPSSAD
ncbi:hypothetical protein PTTG_28530 [Puccinia triticina 1-1 BBBD Race 1]|uniref:GPI-anchored wall transfer protein 1 n=1 Tax=Puccinia triticina (isolate 1-1 / race 1 (BBBD)) TaxID=630390 RepID=A0A180GBT4_PUCT1|nr:hypothetical protein PTTG_28530 [Puccinia triticina 1-1 BBBD Race 1]